MSSLLFLDLETTGVDRSDRICELGLIVEDSADTHVSCSLCKSAKKISPSAMALHHITNESIKEADICTQTVTFSLLDKYNVPENILIAHNVSFDLSMLEKESFHFDGKIVDTLRCTKALIPECEQFSLQFLRYELGLYKNEFAAAKKLDIQLRAHRALSDALHLKLLYENLLEYATLSELIEISSKPVRVEKLPFGKYNGRYIEEIAAIDRAYLHWLIENVESLDEDLSFSISFLLHQK